MNEDFAKALNEFAAWIATTDFEVIDPESVKATLAGHMQDLRALYDEQYHSEEAV